MRDHWSSILPLIWDMFLNQYLCWSLRFEGLCINNILTSLSFPALVFLGSYGLELGLEQGLLLSGGIVFLSSKKKKKKKGKITMVTFTDYHAKDQGLTTYWGDLFFWSCCGC